MHKCHGGNISLSSCGSAITVHFQGTTQSIHYFLPHEDLPVPPSKKSQKSGIGKGEGNERFDRGVAAAGRSSGVMGDETAGLSSFGVELDATVAFLVGVHISGLEFTSCS